MRDDFLSITLSEWQTLGPETSPALTNRFLDSSLATRRTVERLQEGQLLELSELRRGLRVTTRSHVGRVKLGPLEITVLPKIRGLPLLNLVRYAFGFRRLNLISQTDHDVDQLGLEDLLVHQLNAEAQELFSRGLRRSYVSTTERLSSPRGRIDLNRLALDGGTITATLTCQHHPRVEDTLLNQTLLAGLKLASSVSSVVELRRDSLRLASLLEEQVSQRRLDAALLDRAERMMNRLTGAYASAISIIRLLADAQGIVLDGTNTSAPLPGFLFDMNSFFQALISRFLRENLSGYTVRDEHGLRGMMRYNLNFHRPKWRSPTPRPDYVVMQRGAVCSILDAKYRDLWEKPLPREMLYQLVVYAISPRQRPQSSILYPTMNDQAREVRIDISDPLLGKPLGQVCLRPVLLQRIESLIEGKTSESFHERVEYAHQLAFGV